MIFFKYCISEFWLKNGVTCSGKVKLKENGTGKFWVGKHGPKSKSTTEVGKT